MATYHHGNLPGTMLRTAGAMLEARGPEALSLREIARQAGVSHSAPYRHFSERGSLLAALAAEGYERLAQALSEAPPAKVGQTFIAFACERPQRFRLMFGGHALQGRRELKDKAAAAFAVFEKSLASITGDASCAAAAWSLVTGLAQLLLAGAFEKEQAAAGGRAAFVDAVLATVRFAVKAQRSA